VWEFHRLADRTLAWTTKLHRLGERFIGQPMKLSKSTHADAATAF